MKKRLMSMLCALAGACAWVMNASADERQLEGLALESGESAYDFLCRTCDVPDSSTVQAVDGVLSAGEAEIAVLRTVLDSPYPRFRFFFVDDMPDANWAHPCRYVFVSEDWSSATVVDQTWFPYVRDADTGEAVDMTILNAKEEPAGAGSLEEVKSAVYRYANSLEEEANAISYSGDVSKSYFVLISGGASPQKNGIRFWSDTAMFYSTLTRKYGVPKDHIWVFMSDGNATTEDANLASESATPVLVDSPKDLDGDGVGDITGSCDNNDEEHYGSDGPWNYFRNTFFPDLRSRLTSDDQLVIFVTSHGGSGIDGNPESAYAALYGRVTYTDYFTDYDLKEWLDDMPCPVAVIMQSCYSGGFVEEITSVPNRVIATSSAWLETSWGVAGGGAWVDGTVGKTCAFNWWAQPFTAALRGCYTMPWKYQNYLSASDGGYPWVDYAAANADNDGDGLVSIKEAFDYAKAVDQVGDNPQYGENPSGFGSTFCLLKKGSAPAPYTINFHRNDANDGKTAEYEFGYGVSTALPTLDELGWARRGFVFKGWATSAANAAAGKVWKKDGAAVSTATAAGKTLDVYAVWALQSGYYAVKFIRNDGAGTWRTIGFPYGTKTGIPTLAKGLGWARRGYEFKGWETTTANANDNTRANPWKTDGAYISTPVAAGKTLTVYARWQLKSGYYQIRFNKNDGTGKWRTLGFERGKSTKLSTIAALGWTRSGHAMRGWASSKANADARKVWKLDGAWIKDVTSEGKTLSIYAIWD